MKNRVSKDKAEYSQTREEHYRNESNNILFDKQIELTIEGNDVYLKSAEGVKLLHTIERPKSMWYEIWLKLKNI